MSEVVTPFAPPPGSTVVGDLYADLQSRTLWLGVDPAVDPDGAVLLSDIATLQANIAQCLLDAKAYTDDELEAYSPLGHTHNSGQITDFNSAVAGVVSSMPSQTLSPGMIELWAGDPTLIGVGAMSTWLKCDGSSLLRSAYPALFTAIGTRFGTVDASHFTLPDLQDRFVVGAGNTKVQGVPNSLGAVVDTDLKGDHGHVVGDTALTIAQLPSHTHADGTLAGSGTGAGYTDAQGSHTHAITGFGSVGGGGGGYGTGGGGGSSWSPACNAAGSHSHNVTVSSLNVNVTGATAATGSGAGHTHPLPNAGAHTHQISGQALRDAIPYLPLTYIIKT